MKDLSVEEVYKYYEKEYGKIWPAMLEILESFAGTGPQKESNRAFLLHPFGYSETSIECDTWYDIITSSIEEDKLTLTREQADSYLRMYDLVLMFDREKKAANIDDPEQFKQFCLSHPLWKQIEEQAQKTLDLLRIRKDQ